MIIPFLRISVAVTQAVCSSHLRCLQSKQWWKMNTNPILDLKYKDPDDKV